LVTPTARTPASAASGALAACVRPFTPADLDGVLAVEELAFDQLWRYDATGFLDIAREYPYFVVAAKRG
jgi:hypothetical protein